ncbi:MAG: WD40 repeat domain-containing protein [Muribaculaceae bacterium]|nr:WD40 repeat domain-containing protein [Muribaculaceae bacterium]
MSKNNLLIGAMACGLLGLGGSTATGATHDDLMENVITNNSDTQERVTSSEKTIVQRKDYHFKSLVPIKQLEPLSLVVLSATDKGVQNTTGLELHIGKDFIKRISANPAGINVVVIKKNKKGINYLETYTTDGGDATLMKFDTKHYGEPLAAVYSPDARQLIVATDRGTYIFETKKFKYVAELPSFSCKPDMLVFSPNGYFLAAAGNGKVEVMNFEEKTIRRTLNPEEKVTDVVFSKSSDDMAILTADGMVEIYDTRSFNVKLMIDDLNNGRACDFNFDGKYLAVAADDDKVTIINLLKPEDRIVVEVPETHITDVVFIQDTAGNPIMVASNETGLDAKRLQLEPYYAKLVSDEVDMKMSEWLKKMPDETMDDYKLRVNDESRAKQRRLFEDKISTQLAGNLTSMSTVSLGQYDAENEVLAVNFDNMPTIFLPIPRADLGGIKSADDFYISEQQYGLLGDDTFELIYAKFTNKNTGEAYIYDNVNRKPMKFMANDNVVSIELVQQQIMEEIKLKEIKEQVVAEAMKDNIISDHTNISVSSEVIPDYDANGNKILNYNVKFTYQVEPEFSVYEDFAPGKYRAEQSGAASSMLNIVKNAFEGNFANYVKEGKKLNVKISGTADATPIRNVIAYDGAYGDIENEPYYQGNQMSAITVTQKDGIKSNEQLAFLRAYGVKEYLENNVEGLKSMDTRYTYSIGVSEDKGAEFRRITVELIFVDAF